MHGLWQGLLSLDQRFEKLTFLLEPKSMCKLYQGSHEKEWRCSPFSPHKKLKKKIQYAANKEHWTTFEALSPFLTFLLIQLVLWFRVLAAHHKLDTQEIHWYALLVCSASFPDCVGKCDITAQNQLINHTSFMYIYISLSLECLLHTTKTFRLLKYS